MSKESRINGNQIAKEIIEKLKASTKPQKTLVALFVGENSAAQSFLAQKTKVAKELDLKFSVQNPKTEDELTETLKSYAADPQTGGILLQLPLPNSASPDKFLAQIPSELDVDALSPNPQVLSPAVETVKEILSKTQTDASSKSVVIMGKGLLTGAPIAKYLADKCRTLTIVDQGDDRSPVVQADIIISGVGTSGVLEASNLKSGAGVIDFGYQMKDSRICGDLITDSNVEKLSFYTPTPGGTGPILVAKLFENFYKLCGR